jgi:hypothetical protein
MLFWRRIGLYFYNLAKRINKFFGKGAKFRNTEAGVTNHVHSALAA